MEQSDKDKKAKENKKRQEMLKRRYQDNSTSGRALTFKEVVGVEKDEFVE